MVLDYEQPDQQPGEEYCDIREVHERVGRAIMQLVALSHRIAFTSYPVGDGEFAPLLTVADLRKIRSGVLDVTDDAAPCLAKVGTGRDPIWAWYRFLNEPETPTQIRPDDVPAGDPGMWVQQVLPEVACCGTVRYLAHVEYCAAQVSMKELWNRCRGKTPAVFISPVGDEPSMETQSNAFRKLDIRYQIRAMSANWRAGVTARMKPPIKDYEIEDPGTYRTLGDIRRILIHDNTLSIKKYGVEKVVLGNIRTSYEKSAERIICDTMDVRVITYPYTSNTPCEIVSPWTMWIQLQNDLGQSLGPPNQIPGAP